MRFVAGSAPISVYAVGQNYYQKTGVIDNMAAVYRFANGVTGNLVQGDSYCSSLVSKFYLQVFAENKSATLSTVILAGHEVVTETLIAHYQAHDLRVILPCLARFQHSFADDPACKGYFSPMMNC